MLRILLFISLSFVSFSAFVQEEKPKEKQVLFPEYKLDDCLKSLDIKFHLDFNNEKSKANIFFQIGPSVSNGIVLSAHTDVVPTEGQKWAQKP